MKYLASKIIDRSLQLADLSNTDFLTYEEKCQYLQDAWTSVYQQLINKGDKQFVKEADLMNASGYNGYVEYTIPDDLFQICSIKNKISGSIIPRHAESESINSNSYEIVNDRIRLYGAMTGPLLLTYWAVPTYLTFPDKDVEVDVNGNILSSAGNSVLLDSGTIVNLKSGETLGSITIDENKTYQLGNGHVVEHGNLETDTDSWTIGEDLLDKDLNELEVPEGTPDTPTVISEDVYKYNNYYFYAPDKSDTERFLIRDTFTDDLYLTSNSSVSGSVIPTSSTYSHEGWAEYTYGMKWNSSAINNYFAWNNQDIQAAVVSYDLDGDTNYAVLVDLDTEYADEPQFYTNMAGANNPTELYEDNPGLYTINSSTVTGNFVLGYDSNLSNFTLYYKSGSTYYYMNDYRLGSASGNIHEVEYEVTETATISSYTIYNISHTIALYGRYVLGGISYPVCARNTSAYVNVNTGSMGNYRNLEWTLDDFVFFRTSKYSISTHSWQICKFHYYSSVYPITALTPTEITLGDALIQPEFNDIVKAVYEDTNELTVGYSTYRYYYRGLNYKDYNDNVIYNTSTTGSYTTFLDSEYNVNYQVLNDGLYSNPKLFDTELFEMPEDEIIPRFVASHEGLFLFNTQVDGVITLTGYVPELESYIDEYPLDYTPSDIIPVERFNLERAFLVRTSGNKYRLWHFTDDDYVLTDDRVDVKAPLNLALLKYGPLVSNGTNAVIKSRIPDTLLNFPNDFYFSIIAVDLAMRYAMKQNADASGLQAQYNTMWYTFMDTLEQDSGYNRITNVYN